VLQGYLSDLSVLPGEALTAHIGCDASSCHVSVVRLLHGDPNPQGPGLVTVPQPWLSNQAIEARKPATAIGSYLHFPNALPVNGSALSLAMWFQPTFVGEEEQAICSWRSAGRSSELIINQDGLLGLRSGNEMMARHPDRVHPWRWYFIGLTAGAGALVRPVLFAGARGRTAGPLVIEGRACSCSPTPPGDLWVGTTPEATSGIGRLDGKVAGIRCYRSQLDAVALMDIMNGFDAPYAGCLRARWDLSRCNDLDRVVDVSGHDLHGYVINAPARGVAGPRVLPDTELFFEGSSHYDAVHLHSDDIEDASWPPSATIEVPAGTPSGIYSLRVETEGESTYLPFAVKAKVQAPVLFLLPTFTWQAYANLGRDPSVWPGLSNYALHRDGSPVYLSTRLKPSDTFSPLAYTEVGSEDAFIDSGDATAPGAAQRSTHLLMADLYVAYWLETIEARYSAITDGDLNRGGLGALSDVKVLVLSAHPEYWTASMLDAATSFLRRGGNIMYMGGNGLYWVTSVRDDKPHLVEIRRGTDASQTWSAEPGEARHTYDGTPGGPWWQQGRPPNLITGVGFAGFGWDRAVAFERLPVSFQPEFSWVFNGVEAGPIGSVGLNMGGAVAFEFDRHDPLRGAADAVVLARGAPSTRGFFRTFEDGCGAAPDPLVRCDMTLWRTPWGGSVFSLGSVTATGCLPLNEGDNDLARICTNVLREFAGS
jgi:N,N-dimethylformamidase